MSAPLLVRVQEPDETPVNALQVFERLFPSRFVLPRKRPSSSTKPLRGLTALSIHRISADVHTPEIITSIDRTISSR